MSPHSCENTEFWGDATFHPEIDEVDLCHLRIVPWDDLAPIGPQPNALDNAPQAAATWRCTRCGLLLLETVDYCLRCRLEQQNDQRGNTSLSIVEEIR